MSTELEACWDKTTGILCETKIMMSGELLGETIDMSMSIKMTETCLWEAGLLSGQGFLILVVVAIVAVVVAGSAFLLWRRRKTVPLPNATPTPTEQSVSTTKRVGSPC